MLTEHFLDQAPSHHRWTLGAPVVHVRHISRTLGSSFWPGQSGAEFQHDLRPLDGEHVVEKNVPDAFVNTGLERWLHARGIRSVAILGVSTNNSVEATARSSGNLGFKTFVASDGTFAFAKPDFNGYSNFASTYPEHQAFAKAYQKALDSLIRSKR